jgi:hypothetical protein
LKLIGGYFYHTKAKSEEIGKIELDDGRELLCSDLEGKTYKAVIQ